MRSALRLEVSGGRRVGLCPEDQHCSMARLQAGREESSRELERSWIVSRLLCIDPGRPYSCGPN